MPSDPTVWVPVQSIQLIIMRKDTLSGLLVAIVMGKQLVGGTNTLKHCCFVIVYTKHTNLGHNGTNVFLYNHSTLKLPNHTVTGEQVKYISRF